MGVDTIDLIKKILQSRDPEDFIKFVKFPKDFTLAEYLNKLLEEKKLARTEIIKKSLLNQVTTNHIFEGRTKKPARTRLLALALAMELNSEETNKLLTYGEAAAIYPRRNTWEAIIFLGIERRWGVPKTNEALFDAGESPLLGDIN